jgi:GNAT-family acetyltransferase (TIGR03103 family)
VVIRRVASQSEASAINDLYIKRDMVPSDAQFIWERRESRQIIFLVAVDESDGTVLGTVTGLDHAEIFSDPANGSSLWCLAVDPTALHPGVGEALLRELSNHFKRAGRSSMDLSVIHDNVQAKSLYEKLGFKQFQAFSIKRKNAYNVGLFLGPELEEELNPYARIIVDEARARGISVEILDAQEGYFRLSRGGTSIVCRESLSELTTAIAMSRCQDKYVTHRWLSRAGLQTPAFQLSASLADDLAFLDDYESIVVKPADGEQGKGITVGVDNEEALIEALTLARGFSHRVLLESCHPGEDLRVVVINYEVVAAAVRRPAQIVGDGIHTALKLIHKQSRRRHAATSGESKIPVDAETRRCLAEAGFGLDEVIPADLTVNVRKTANLHTGGTIHDVTAELHPTLCDAARQAARRLEIPVVGLDFMVVACDQPEHVIIEANERVGLANHQPRPTAERFVDLLFPLSAKASLRYTPDATDTD